MAEFRVKKYSGFYSAEFNIGKGWMPLSSISFRTEKDAKNTVFIEDMADTFKVPLPQAEEKKRQDFIKRFGVREEFIRRFGTSPIRILWIALAKRHGSVKNGLRIIPITQLNDNGRAFMERIEREGLVVQREGIYFVNPNIIGLAKAQGPLIFRKPSAKKTEKPKSRLRRRNPAR